MMDDADITDQVKEPALSYRIDSEQSKEEIRAILKARAEGFKLLDNLDLVKRRNATFADKFHDVAVLFAFAQRLRGQQIDPFSAEVARRWQKARAPYAGRG